MKYLLCIAFSLTLASWLCNVNGQNIWQPERGKKYIILSEQSTSRVAIADITTGQIVWE